VSAPADDERARAFRQRLRQAIAQPNSAARVQALCVLAEDATGYLDAIQLDRALADSDPDAIGAVLERLRLAVLSSTTVDHLVPGIRVAGVRRGFYFDVFAGGFGQYRHELMQPSQQLRKFAPDVIVLSTSARPLVSALRLDASADDVESALRAEVVELRALWKTAREQFDAVVLQQTFFDVFEPVFGGFDRLAAAAPARLVGQLNDRLAQAAREDGVALLDVARASARDGLDAWFDPARWLQAKMEISPAAANRFGELVSRVVAAQRGRSRKCVVFDLDDTLWGGVVGDVGVERLVLGEGSAVGEAHLELQRYARRLKERGVILAVCSKNDPAIAEDAFSRHPEMALCRSDIACFVANWQDKAENLRCIAEALNIGLDSLVFVDDNPAERARVREALPMVAVPELPADPALYVRALASQGYFEAVAFTQDDAMRAASYAANVQRDALRAEATSMDQFLQGLDMEVQHGPIGAMQLERATQLINKTNQFNTTGRRYAADEVARLAADKGNVTLQFRLVDRLGDNGLVSVMILRPAAPGADHELEIDAWVMSCRVFGRQLEDEAMNIAAEEARARGAIAITARFVPTNRNGVIGHLFPGLGFRPSGAADATGVQRWRLALSAYEPRPTHIRRGNPRP
jgi:FkbH-like protein